MLLKKISLLTGPKRGPHVFLELFISFSEKEVRCHAGMILNGFWSAFLRTAL